MVNLPNRYGRTRDNRRNPEIAYTAADNRFLLIERDYHFWKALLAAAEIKQAPLKMADLLAVWPMAGHELMRPYIRKLIAKGAVKFEKRKYFIQTGERHEEKEVEQ